MSGSHEEEIRGRDVSVTLSSHEKKETGRESYHALHVTIILVDFSSLLEFLLEFLLVILIILIIFSSRMT